MYKHLSLLVASLAPLATGQACNSTALNATIGSYYVTVEGTTVFDIANQTSRGVCDIGRANLMADVTIPPNVGQTLRIPGEVCEPDQTTCLLPENGTNTCIYGGPRLYYTQKGDTLAVVARRLNLTTDSIATGGGGQSYSGSTNVSAPLQEGQFIKIPRCVPSACVIEPYVFSEGVYLDLARKYGTTVGQIMMLSPTYNFSSIAFSEGGMFPPITMAYNCTALSDNVTVSD
ncbi:hypothetical protein F5Y03DRAFT_362180 [Xylaria venustula]|nr:hypothetical protein F5Y03DRAFT_362180 [Xylaria venustula]